MDILRRRKKCQIFSILPLSTDPGSAIFLTAPSATENFFWAKPKLFLL